MNTFTQTSLIALFPLALAVLAQERVTTPIPSELRAPDGHVLFLKAHATGTQNYICSPSASGPAWRFLGPQATLFVTVPWPGRDLQQQVTTHYLSANASEGGMLRPSWQHSFDTSRVWAKPVASFSGAPVEPGAVPWLLLQVVGAEAGPTGGSALRPATYIQRLNTSGGVAPSAGCDATAYGALAFVPYSTDYLFYRLATK